MATHKSIAPSSKVEATVNKLKDVALLGSTNLGNFMPNTVLHYSGGERGGKGPHCEQEYVEGGKGLVIRGASDGWKEHVR